MTRWCRVQGERRNERVEPARPCGWGRCCSPLNWSTPVEIVATGVGASRAAQSCFEPARVVGAGVAVTVAGRYRADLDADGIDAAPSPVGGVLAPPCRPPWSEPTPVRVTASRPTSAVATPTTKSSPTPRLATPPTGLSSATPASTPKSSGPSPPRPIVPLTPRPSGRRPTRPQPTRRQPSP
jgi:hypothetical protein